MPSPLASVVIPAHNEERVIGRCLTALLADARPHEFEVVVVANGCTDDTTGVARGFPGVQVESLETASKHAALNRGDAVATAFPRIYLDADVELTTDAARRTAGVLRDGQALVAAPTPEFVLDGRPWPIRAFYRAWRRSRFLTHQVIGNGVYALSAQGRKRFGEFPPITGDDYFVLAQFGEHERSALATSTFRIHPPRDVRSLVRVRSRVYFGNAELDDHPDLAEDSPSGSARSALDLVLGCRSPTQLADAAVYLGVNGLAKLRARRQQRAGVNRPTWERDDSSRSRPDPVG